jgi:hypothetical protein
MPRKIRSPLEYRSKRLELAPRKKPYSAVKIRPESS